MGSANSFLQSLKSHTTTQLGSDLNQDKQLDPDTQTFNGIHSPIKKHSYRKIAKKMQWCIS